MDPKTDKRRQKKTRPSNKISIKPSSTKNKTDTKDINSLKKPKYLTGQQKRKASASATLPEPKLKRRKFNKASDPETVDCNIQLELVQNKKKKRTQETTRKTRQALQKRKKSRKKVEGTTVKVKKGEHIDDTLEEIHSKPKKTTRIKSKKQLESKEEIDQPVEEVQCKTRGRLSKRAGDKKVKKEEKTEMKSALTPGIRGLSKHAKANKYVGAHTSISGGLQNAVHEAVMLGARAFGLFLKSQRQWACKPLQDKDADKFKQAMQECGFSPDMVVPHGSYLLNCGAPNEEILQKSRDGLTDELQRCEKLGLAMFNFHPGSTCKQITVEECLSRIAKSINIAHSKTKYVTTVLENMSCQGGTVGGKFSELASIIEQVKDKSRVGVCLDTCHTFAAGYDLRTEAGYKQTMSEFEKVVGFQYLRAVHVNDSKGPKGCHRDRHENIGCGHLGLEAFRRVMNDPRFDNTPLIIETPMDVGDAEEIDLLYSLISD